MKIYPRSIFISRTVCDDGGYPYHLPHPTKSLDKPKEEDFIKEKEFKV